MTKAEIENWLRAILSQPESRLEFICGNFRLTADSLVGEGRTIQQSIFNFEHKRRQLEKVPL